jgi:hypothetical protein
VCSVRLRFAPHVRPLESKLYAFLSTWATSRSAAKGPLWESNFSTPYGNDSDQGYTANESRPAPPDCPYTFTVPASVTSITITAAEAGGGPNDGGGGGGGFLSDGTSAAQVAAPWAAVVASL